MSLLSRAVVAAAARMGLSLTVRRQPRDNTYPQAINLPMATYAPWKHDTGFLTLYEKIRAHTLVDIYRCYELWQLVAQSAKCEGALVEVGVWRGGTGALIAQRARELGLKDTVYCCDTFTGLKKVGALDPAYRDDDYNDTSAGHVEALYRPGSRGNARLCGSRRDPQPQRPRRHREDEVARPRIIQRVREPPPARRLRRPVHGAGRLLTRSH